MQRILTGLIGLMLAGGALAVDVYKCADPRTGNLMISQTPCAPDARRESVWRGSARSIRGSARQRPADAGEGDESV